MTGFLIRRLLSFVPVLFLTTVIVFSLVHLAPGDPVSVLIGEDRADPAVIANIRHQMGFDKPLPMQYLIWLNRVVRGNFGYSYLSRESVINIVASRLPLTGELTVLSILFGILVAAPLGVTAALRRNHWPDVAASVFAAVGASMPAFWMGILLIFLFALRFKLLPPSGFVPLTTSVTENLKYMVLPVITLGTSYAAVLTRFFRASLLDVMSAEFIRTARAKGLSERVVVTRHIFRNALVPIITVVGLETGRLLGGAILTETIFALPGMGKLAVDSILGRDFPTMQATVMFMVLAVLMSNLVVDLLYGVVDPRIRV